MADLLRLSGRPGVGKTILLRRLAHELECRAGGVYPEEIRERGGRVGFRLVTLDGSAKVSARVRWHDRPHRVGRYGVDLVVLDHLGVEAIRRVVASGKVVLVATILASSHPWADSIRCRPGCTEFVLTPANRGEVFERALQWVLERCPVPGP